MTTYWEHNPHLHNTCLPVSLFLSLSLSFSLSLSSQSFSLSLPPSLKKLIWKKAMHSHLTLYFELSRWLCRCLKYYSLNHTNRTKPGGRQPVQEHLSDRQNKRIQPVQTDVSEEWHSQNTFILTQRHHSHPTYYSRFLSFPSSFGIE